MNAALLTQEEGRNMDGVIEQHIADAVSEERERCAYIVQALHDQFVHLATDFSNYKPQWPYILKDIQAVVRKIESGEPPNPYWKPSRQLKGLPLETGGPE